MRQVMSHGRARGGGRALGSSSSRGSTSRISPNVKVEYTRDMVPTQVPQSFSTLVLER